jgi:hypothetical protein
MKFYLVTNKKYNINFNLVLDTFDNFIESLKVSKNFYHSFCKSNNISIINFDHYYKENIYILQGELLKYYILINDNLYTEKYIIINDIISDLYNYMINQLCQTFRSYYALFPHFRRIGYLKEYYSGNTDDILIMEISETDINFLKYLDINNLTRDKLFRLIYIYACNCNRFVDFTPIFLTKMNIQNKFETNYSTTKENYTETVKNFDDSLDNYLDTLTYESIYERELNKILNNLPNICLSNLKYQ